MPGSSLDALHRAVVIGIFSSIVAAIAGTAIVFFAWRAVAGRTGMRLVENFLCFLALLTVYLLSSMLIISGAYQANSAAEDSLLSYSYVHPGPLQRLAPAAAMVATWLLLLGASTWTTLRKTQ